MNNFQLTTPVVFIIFNRPEVTKLVFEEIRKARPKTLMVIADGPRLDKAGEAYKCNVVRSIIDSVDWDCNVIKNYSDINLGCGKRVASGLNWVFEMVEEAIILEDDCLPHQSFFPFCQELLERYRYDNRIMTISGDNFQFGRKRTLDSYYFSRYVHVWGWATWRRVWKSYDFNMQLWPQMRDGKWLFDIFGSMEVDLANYEQKAKILGGVKAVKSWYQKLERTYNGNIDTWDYQLLFQCLLQSGLHIIPNVNLVSNIGFTPEGTHTKNSKSYFANVPLEAMEFPLRHSPYMIRDAWADEFTQWMLYSN